MPKALALQSHNSQSRGRLAFSLTDSTQQGLINKNQVLPQTKGRFGMKALWLLALCTFLTLVPRVPSSAVSSQKLEKRTVRGISFISVGVVSRELALVRPDKLAGSTRTLPNGQNIYELPQPSEYYVGTIYQFQIEEILKGNKMARVGQSIDVLVPGQVTLHSIALSQGRKYLLMMSPLKEGSEKYEGMQVMDLAHPSGAGSRFDVDNAFGIERGIYGAIPVTEENRKLIKSIRADARKR